MKWCYKSTSKAVRRMIVVSMHSGLGKECISKYYVIKAFAVDNFKMATKMVHTICVHVRDVCVNGNG